MIDNSGISPSELSRRLHKSRTYINTLRRQESAPSLPTFARLAHECGYKLKLERADGQQIELYNEDDAEEYWETEAEPVLDITEVYLDKASDVRAAYTFETEKDQPVTEEEWELMQTDIDSPRFRELYNLIISHAENPEREKKKLAGWIEELRRPIPDDVWEKAWESRRRERRKRMEEEEEFFKA